ncbi:hypothetical protein GW943_00545 [Candidatus Parcubacteria bacterium]|uniref:Penicillin-binding protein 2 n=1 Tax=Candidatus Kaiserbacteria bacterium CG10_big_fil_rev_8_21_14_0_10_47_16 TaxID=1974608 RepID=A0A2H0UD59_9BACT|nr:hypothetical protein [Candidatus Parcubacteria bacterium]PIR84332.1 MAG: hypothetical protein COU16_01925 [Candidatus Kaiserbacteria bacterium CG10_big_fil_rev_8_21_14_0_10_47_16]
MIFSFFGFRKRRIKKSDISLDEILLDSSNLPAFNTGRMEGKLEQPIGKRNIVAVGLLFLIVVSVFGWKLFTLQIVNGAAFAERSKQNGLLDTLIVAERGVVRDRNGELLAWNEVDQTGEYNFPVRAYSDRQGLGQVIGYVSYPQKDTSGFYFREEYLGRTGIEESFDTLLAGKNGHQLVESTVHGEVISEHVIDVPQKGKDIELSLDAGLTEFMYQTISSSTKETGFRSGAGAIMDVQTGEILAMTSFPSYDPEILSDGDDVAAIAALNKDTRFPFLNKITGGVYIPGSIVKPFVAYAALAENVISPDKIIVSNGSISIPNPYNPSNPSIFNDWRAHGPMNMVKALAFSSDVYFYEIGGGFKDQPGLGILKIDEYMKLFGIGEKTGIPLFGEVSGTIPTPEWKRKTFDDDWRLGDTYFTSIGQYGFSVTPLQMLRAYAALANNGTLLQPQVIKDSSLVGTDLGLNQDDLAVVHQGIRETVIGEGGTVGVLRRNDVTIAAKSGTAELDSSDTYLNTWVAGYFPYEKPRYAFILFMEKGPYTNTVSAGRVMNKVFDWMTIHRPDYLLEEE